MNDISSTLYRAASVTGLREDFCGFRKIYRDEYDAIMYLADLGGGRFIRGDAMG